MSTIDLTQKRAFPSYSLKIDAKVLGRARSIFHICLPLIGLGAVFEALLISTQVLAPELGWYPSRLGLPAEWLDERVYAPARLWLYGVTNVFPMLPAVAYFGALALMFGLYALAVRFVWRRGDGGRAIKFIALGLPAIFMLTLIAQPYLSSQDIFSYAFYSHMSAFYGGNPYIGVPRDYSFDPLFSAIFWTDQSSNYGPLWTGIGVLITAITGTNTALTLIGIKLVSTLFALATIPLVWRLLDKLAPSVRLGGTVLYAWNPLLILETAGSGHNDSIVGFFAVLGIYLYARNARSGGLAAIILSALAKYVTAVLLPLYMILWLRDCTSTRERLLALGKSGAVTVALLAVAYLPIYSGPATFQVARFGTSPSGYVNSPLELAFGEIRVLLGESRDLATLSLKPHLSWVMANSSTTLRASASYSALAIATVPQDDQLLVVDVQPGGQSGAQSGGWLHVYDPRLDRMGYVSSLSTLRATDADSPGPATTLAVVTQLINSSATSQQANMILRLAAGAMFIVLMAVFIWRTASYQQLLYYSLAALVASYWLLQTWFWPWYLVWALPLAAAVPRRRLAALLFVFSLTALTLHGPGDGPPGAYVDLIYEYRSIAVFGLPIIAIAVVLAVAWLRRRGRFSSVRPPASMVVVSSSVLLAIAITIAFAGMMVQADDKYRSQEAPGHSMADSAASLVRDRLSLDPLARKEHLEPLASPSRTGVSSSGSPEDQNSGAAGGGDIRHLDEAIAKITRIMNADGIDENRLLSRGRAYQQTQRFDLAVDDFDRAILYDGADPRPFRYRAQSYFQLGLIDEAIASQQKALTLDSHSAEMYVELAGMYATLGHFRKAETTYDTAISLNSRTIDAHVGRASVRRILKQNSEAIDDLRQVVALTGDDVLRNWALRMIETLQSGNIL